MDLNELARAYWTAPPYEDHDHSDGFEKHPFDMIQDLQLDASDEELSELLRALAVSAPSENQLAYVGTQWVEGLEYKFDAEGDPGKSIHILLAAGLDNDHLYRVLSGIYPDWLESMGAARILEGALSAEHIMWLVDSDAPDRRAFL